MKAVISNKSGKRTTEQAKEARVPKTSRAWRGTWNRPMSIDEDSYHPFTIARMTNRNVRGVNGKPDERSILKRSSGSTGQKNKKVA